MELEELKNRWSSLERQLKNQEFLNEKLVREIRQSKSGPLKILINYAYFGIVLCILVEFFLLYVYNHAHFAAFKTSIFICGGLMLIFTIILGFYNISCLKKIDFTKNVSDNIKIVETYKMNYKKQLVASYILLACFLVLVIIGMFLSIKVELWRWIGVCAAIPVIVVLGYLEYKKIFKDQTDAILKSLEELKELEE